MAEKRIKIIYETETVDLEKANDILLKCATSQDKAAKEAREFSQESKKAGQTTAKSFQSASKESDKFAKTVNTSKKSLVDLNGVAGKVGTSLAAAFTVTAAIGIGKKIFDITAEFQKFEAVLTNTLGSQKQAQGAMAEISTAAAKTNFSVQELTDSYIKFANRGVKLSQAEMLKLADIANSTGKSFDQLAEATLDAFTGENERLKEFGIIAKKTGETTQFTFKGVTTEVKNTQAEISKYLLSLADLKGVTGTTAAISATLEGRVSNLGDAFDQLFLNIGKGTTGFLPGLISGFTDFINLIGQSFKTIQQIKNEVSALSLSSALRADIDEVNALAEAYVRNGKTIEEATASAAKDVIHSLKNLRDSWDFQGSEADINERINNLNKTFKAQKQVADSEIGILARLRKELKETQEARENATSVKDINKANVRIKKIQEEIQRLEGVEKQAERTKIALEKLAGVDFMSGLTTYGLRTKSALEQIYEKMYGEQVKGEGEASDAIKARSDRFIAGAEESMKAFSMEQDFKKAKAEKELAEEQARLERRKEMIANYTSAGMDLVNSYYSYQNTLDQNRLNNLEEAKQKEISLAGDNSKARAQIELEYDARIRALRKKQSDRDKRVATFNAIINTIQGVTKAIAQGGLAGIVLGAVVAAAGYAQVRQIQKTEPPGFNKGTKSVPGASADRDTVHTMLTPGEMVFSKKTKKKYWPVLDKIFDHKIDPELLNGIAKGHAYGGSVSVVNDNKELVRAIEGRPVHEWNVSGEDIELLVRKRNSRTRYIKSRYSER